MRTITVLFLAIAPMLGCIPDVETSKQKSGADGGTAGGGGGGGCVDPGSCGDGGTGGVGPTCGAQTFPLGSAKVAPNVYFIVDASGSMASGPPFGDYDPTKWQGLQSALGNVLTTHVGQAQFGLSIFPSGNNGNSCNPGQVDVAIGAGTESAITTKINSVSALTVFNREGLTPTGSTMAAAVAVGGLKDTTRPNYVVLMTDGQPNCESSSYPPQGATMNKTVNAITALANATPAVKTFVVGFGDVNNSSPDYLNAFATAGGTARTGSTKFYPAQNAADLENAFNQIVSGVASCDYKLDMPPDDPSLVAPTFDGKAVLQSATNGFSYDPGTQTVTFHGMTCDQIRSGSVMKVEFVYGCPASTVL